MLLAALAPLSAAAPVGAHSPVSAAVPPAALVLAAAAAAWGSPRRAVVLALVLLLGTFAFENALHSVHHGLDTKQHDECAIASASAHLAAVEGNGVADTGHIRLAAERPADIAPMPAPTRFISPVQGRAPPAAIL